MNMLTFPDNGHSTHPVVLSWINNGQATIAHVSRTGVQEIELSTKLWSEIPKRILESTDAVDRSNALAEYRTLTAITGATEPPLEIVSIGIVIGKNYECFARIEGERITESKVNFRKMTYEINGREKIMTPLAHDVFLHTLTYQQRLKANTASPRSIYVKANEWIQIASRLETTLKVDATLKSYDIKDVVKIIPRWVPGDSESTVSLKVGLQTTDGQEFQLDVAPDQDNILRINNKSLLKLPHNVQKLLETSLDNRNQTRREAAHKIIAPNATLPEHDMASDLLDLSDYSARVIGFVPLSSVPRDTSPSGIDWFESVSAGSIPFLTITPSDGVSESVIIPRPEDARRLMDDFQQAASQNQNHVTFGGRILPVDPSVIDIVSRRLTHWEQISQSTDVNPDSNQTNKRKVVKIGEDPITGLSINGPTDSQEAAKAAIERLQNHYLQPNIKLKPHQIEGVTWMYTRARPAIVNLDSHPSGVLLADDMGLGKTLQALSTLAILEDEFYTAHGKDAKLPPSLIVCPKTLLENWRNEATKFFNPDPTNAIPSRLSFLSSSTIKSQWSREKSTADTLNTHQTQIYLINYELYNNFQLDLLRTNWFCMIVDEAHTVKNAETAKARALRGTQFRFALCLTGTPVENTLLDFWSIMDIASHGAALGTIREFRELYHTDPPATGATRLKQTLQFTPGKINLASNVCRRMREDLSERLPKLHHKYEHCTMTPEQTRQEDTIRYAVMNNPGSHLQAIQNLDALYQHPRLLTKDTTEVPIAKLIKESPRLETTIKLLREIQTRGEKAIVFTRYLEMQDILRQAFEYEFQLPSIGFINGESNTRIGRDGGGPTSIIKEFESKSGFNVLIVSPISGGTGLTITAANHVIHYGRWWNPAREDQSTARAHRIGQKKEVTVYIPILRRPNSNEKSYDENLEVLVTRKRELSSEMLSPTEMDYADAFRAMNGDQK